MRLEKTYGGDMDFLDDIVQKRYACKKFDGRKVPEEKIARLKEIIRLAPSSFGLQPWKIKIVTDAATKEKLKAASWNQGQITTCSHVFVICARLDYDSLQESYARMLKTSGIGDGRVSSRMERIGAYIKKMDVGEQKKFAQLQCYLAIGNALNGAKSLGLDSCPMGGFDPQEYSKILGLPEHLIPTLVVPVGYAADTQENKLRYPEDEVFF
jgi:nitroreductase / dihydropteridine reductase